MLFEGGAAEALARAEALREDLAREPLSCAGQRIPVTVSIGVGAFEPARHGDADGLYRAVDLALYAAKDRGRNRVQALVTAEA
jgi:diguanylate cyclase (GGDEF)-like protein